MVTLNDRRYRAAASGVCLLCLLLSLGALAHLASIEFGARKAMPLQVDELFFATCAARGQAVGQHFIAGCHDNKAPLIFSVYRLVNDLGDPYNLVNIKAAAFTLGLLVAALGAITAFLLQGTRAALLVAAFVLNIFVVNSSLLALKTELLGCVFAMAGTLMLVLMMRRGQSCYVFGAGLFFGLALLSKQTFAFAVVGVMLWMAVSGRTSRHERIGPRFFRVAVFAAGASFPMLLLGSWFFVTGRGPDFLASTFLYPSTYRGDITASFLALSAWRIGLISELIQPLLITSILGTAAIFVAYIKIGEQTALQRDHGNQLIACIAGSMIVLALVSPILMRYHIIPAWIFLAALCGLLVDRMLTAMTAERRALALPVFASLIAFFIQAAAGFWYGPASRAGRADEYYRFEAAGGGGSPYAYVVGTWPEFYTFNRFLPASDIMFPNALKGAPKSWYYTPPSSDSLRGHLLNYMHRLNDARILKDFAQTPPSFIMVVNAMAKAPSSKRVTDIDVLNNYIAARCTLDRVVEGRPMHAGALYRCHTPQR